MTVYERMLRINAALIEGTPLSEDEKKEAVNAFLAAQNNGWEQICFTDKKRCIYPHIFIPPKNGKRFYPSVFTETP